MHDSLRLSKMHRLPLRLKIAAEKALSRGPGMMAGLDVLAATDTKEHGALLLPVFYALLDTAILPELRATGFVEGNRDATQTYATCALRGIDGMQRVTHAITATALPAIWRRCWAWVDFLTEYTPVLSLPWSRTDTATRPGALPALWLRIFTHFLDHCVALKSAVFGETRGFRVMVGEAWAHFVHADPDNAAGLRNVAVTLTLIMNSPDADVVKDVAEGAGGKRALATLIVHDLYNEWPDAKPATSASFRRAASLFAFMRLALDHGLTAALQEEEIVAALTTACTSMSVATPGDGMRAELMYDALSLLVRVLDGPWPQVRAAEAIEEGLFAVLHTMTRWASPANTTLMLKLFRDTLPPLLPLRPVAAVLQEALLEVRDLDSAFCIRSPELFRAWERLSEQAVTRVVLFNAYKDRGSQTALVACSNLECCNIWERHAMKQCAGCRRRLYCSRLCQRQDWRYGKHRRYPIVRATDFKYPLVFITAAARDILAHHADREFAIAVLNHEYRVQRSSLATHILRWLLTNRNPNSELVVRWAYRYENFQANNDRFLVANTTVIALQMTPYAGFYGSPGSGTPMRRAFDAGRVMLHVLDLNIPTAAHDTRSYALLLHSATGTLFAGLRRLGADIMAAGGSAADVESYAPQIAALVEQDALVAHSAVWDLQPVSAAHTLMHTLGIII
ncbi:MYND-type domain-containing protein [Mycena indigotica]|uniref:MYND-type domain-containing protein n=1 Tax=Mycena indigotica TaxID=2126181 RepID=A0A8H6T4T6_9AGAR|nr:MYND-type domain-containing protein [Mycena indigotica]KAF7310256.1 MYND-type domain-containing protein [Mycena indigotica]